MILNYTKFLIKLLLHIYTITYIKYFYLKILINILKFVSSFCLESYLIIFFYILVIIVGELRNFA